jgi:hypothetical protein
VDRPPTDEIGSGIVEDERLSADADGPPEATRLEAFEAHRLVAVPGQPVAHRHAGEDRPVGAPQAGVEVTNDAEVPSLFRVMSMADEEFDGSAHYAKGSPT